MATVGSLSIPQQGFSAVIFDCDGTLVDTMPAHFEAWCEALAQFGAANVLAEDVFYAMGGRPTKDIVMDLNAEYGLKLDPARVALSKREAFLRKLVEAAIEQYPDMDIQNMRTLIRNARREKEQNKPPKAYREIFRVLKDMGL